MRLRIRVLAILVVAGWTGLAPAPLLGASRPEPDSQGSGSGSSFGIESLIDDLGNYQKREAAIATLAEIGSPAIPALIEALRADSLTVDPIPGAAEAVRRIGPDVVEAVPALLRAIGNHEQRQSGTNPSHRRSSGAAEEALLRDCSLDESVQSATAEALRRIEADSAEGQDPPER